MYIAERWQYPAKAEPVAVPQAFDNFGLIAAETTLIVRAKVVQIQSKAEPVFVPTAVVTPDFGWFIQQPDVIRRKPQTRQGFYIRGYDNTEISPDFDWFLQQADVTRRKPQTRTGFYARGYDNTEISPDFDWFVQATDVVRRKPQTREGFYVSPFEAELIEVDLDWFRQYPEQVFRRKSQAPQGFIVRGYDNSELTPDFDWFKRQPEPLPRPIRPYGLFSLVEFQAPVVFDIDWLFQTADIILPRHQTGEGWFVRGLDDTEIPPSFGWFHQRPEPLPRPTAPEGFYARGYDSRELALSFDWFHQQVDIIRPRHQVEPGWLAFVDFSVPAEFDIDWLRQQPDPVRRPKSLVPEGFYIIGQPPITEELPSTYTSVILGGRIFQFQQRAEPFRFEAEVPPFDWFKQHPEPLPKYRRPRGFEIYGYDNTEISPDFDWFQQQADITRRRPQARTGLFATVVEPEHIEIDLDWFVQHPEIIFRRRPPVHTEWKRGYDNAEIFPDFDWFRQYPEPQPKPTRPEGWFARGYTNDELAPSFDWFKQQPEPLPRPTRPEGSFVRGYDNTEIAPDFDWLVQQADLIPRRVSQTPALIPQILFVEEVVTPDKWFQIQANPIIRPRRLEGLYARGYDNTELAPSFGWENQRPGPLPRLRRPEGIFVVDPTTPVPEQVTLDKWYVQHHNPRLPILWLLGDTARPLLDIAAPIPDLVFELRDCLILWELHRNRLLPIPSGFIATIESLDPSGFIRVLISITSSGYVRPSSALPDPSGFVKISETLPDPSGFVAQQDTIEPSGWVGT